MRQMKDSLIPWIGKIPEEWNLIRNKRVMKRIKDIHPHYLGETVLSLSMNGVIARDLDNPYGKMPESFDGYQYVNKDNLLMCLFDIDVTPRCVGVIECDGVTSPAYSQFELLNDNDTDYYYYYYLYLDHRKELLHLAKNLRHSFTEAQLGELIVPVPPVVEQVKIADYLDSKCSQIDSIIEKQEAIIEKLKEYKLSVITEAVTKGLDPNVEMKDSGVEWLGFVPSHWVVCRVKNIYQNVKKPVKVGPFGSQLTTADYLSEGKWVYTQRVVLDNDFDNNDTFIGIDKFVELNGFAVEAGDVLVTTRGTGTTGHIAQVPEKHYEGILHPCLMRIRIDENTCLYSYLYFVFEYGNYIKSQIDYANNTSSLPVLYSYTLNNLYLALPDIQEQKRIIEYLVNKTTVIDKKILRVKKVIEELTDYKKSLIYEVVTGKREVA